MFSNIFYYIFFGQHLLSDVNYWMHREGLYFFFLCPFSKDWCDLANRESHTLYSSQGKGSMQNIPAKCTMLHIYFLWTKSKGPAFPLQPLGLKDPHWQEWVLEGSKSIGCSYFVACVWMKSDTALHWWEHTSMIASDFQISHILTRTGIVLWIQMFSIVNEDFLKNWE